MNTIINLFIEDSNIYRLIYRLVRRFGPMNIEFLAILVSHAMCKVYPEICKTVDDSLLYMSMKYGVSLQTIVSTVQSHGFIRELSHGSEVAYIVSGELSFKDAVDLM